MRTIKFRGEHISEDRWLYGNYSELNGIHFITPKVGAKTPSTQYEVKPETSGQFTGLTDKNGKEIYEGDIAIVKSSLNNKEYILPLIYKDGCFVFWSDEQNQGIVLHKLSLDRIEIIGSIHDNPELLTNNNQ